MKLFFEVCCKYNVFCTCTICRSGYVLLSNYVRVIFVQYILEFRLISLMRIKNFWMNSKTAKMLTEHVHTFCMCTCSCAENGSKAEFHWTFTIQILV